MAPKKATAAETALPRLGFVESRGLLDSAIAKVGSGPGFGGITLSVKSGLSEDALDVVATSRTLQAQLNRILINVGSLGVRKIIAETRRLDLYKTGLTLSRWRSARSAGDGRRFNTRVTFLNDTPYLVYEHPKGTPKSRTFLTSYLPGVMAGVAVELKKDLIAFKRSPAVKRAIKAAIL
jgi:hypothetical protein